MWGNLKRFIFIIHEYAEQHHSATHPNSVDSVFCQAEYLMEASLNENKVV